ncbi:hypothetical protein FM037_08045 [Shewanella psychropiezotolerans]|uniref:Uncharacterized protein n=1 Tax=Shewanella psychropiezotolerans TaxID=2593655 RepID=A0ABX5WVS7_9GAMM|nr:MULTISPECIES: hypothetical protein [Shewanella]MPY22501.1 hypothetical protein [Shewanella sp. YLB-07]QDO83184.1 hypothetical protein FM037_08045 [Shewanella psychropiezotolerans]
MSGHFKLLVFLFSMLVISVSAYFFSDLGGRNIHAFKDGDWVFDVRHYVNNTDDYLAGFNSDLQGVFRGRLRFYNDNHYSVTFSIVVKELNKDKVVNVNNEVNLNGIWDAEQDIINFNFENFHTLKPMGSDSDEEFLIHLAINVLNRTFGEGQKITWLRGNTFILNNINQSQIIFNKSNGT